MAWAQGRAGHKYYFLVTPQELSDVLAGVSVHLVIDNARVPADYLETRTSEYVRAYERYFDQLFGSAQIDREIIGSLYIGVAPDLKLFQAMPCPDARYKLLHPQEPIPNLAPFTISYEGNSLYVDATMKSAAHCGLRLAYPKVISLAREKHRVLHEAERYRGCALFQAFQEALQKVTASCAVQSSSRIHNTRLRISETAKCLITNRPAFKEVGLYIL